MLNFILSINIEPVIFEIFQNKSSYLITDSNGHVTHFDPAAFTDPQTLTLDVLDPDVNTC